MAVSVGVRDRHGPVASVQVPKGEAKTYDIFAGEPEIIRLIKGDLISSTNQ